MMMRMRIVVVFFPPDMFRWQVPVVLVLFEDILKMMAWASLDKDSRLPETSQEPLCPEVLAVPPWCLAAETRDATPRLSLLTRFRPKIGTLNSQIPLLWAKTQKPSGLIFFFPFFPNFVQFFQLFLQFFTFPYISHIQFVNFVCPRLSAVPSDQTATRTRIESERQRWNSSKELKVVADIALCDRKQDCHGDEDMIGYIH